MLRNGAESYRFPGSGYREKPVVKEEVSCRLQVTGKCQPLKPETWNPVTGNRESELNLPLLYQVFKQGPWYPSPDLRFSLTDISAFIMRF